VSASPSHLAGGERLGQDGEALDLHADLAGAGLEEGALDADEVGQVEVLEDLEAFVAEGLLLGVDLDAAGDVLQVEELALAHVAMGGDAAGDGDGVAFGEFALLELLPCFAAADAGGEPVAERENAFGLQRAELAAALFDERVGVFHTGARTKAQAGERRKAESWEGGGRAHPAPLRCPEGT
jgi:hypothetical protein